MAIPTADEKLAMIRLAEPTEDELRAVETLAPGDYEIGFQRTNDILDEALEVFQRSSRSAPTATSSTPPPVPTCTRSSSRS